MKIPFITEAEVSGYYSPSWSLRVIEKAFAGYARKESTMPPKVYITVEHGDFRAMPAAHKQYAAIKWVSVHPDNRTKKLPAVQATVLLNDARTGRLLAVFEGSTITAIRTGAAGGAAARLLSRKDSRILALVGCGIQSRYQAEAVCSTRKITSIRIFDQNKDQMRKWQQWFKQTPYIDQNRVSVEVCSSARSCVNGADIVVTTTPARHGFIKADWLKAGCHINAIGADADGKQEFDPEVLKKCRVIVDDKIQAAHSGEINKAVTAGVFKVSAVRATLGEVAAGLKKGRLNERQITLFDSTGLAVQDIALAEALYKKVKQKA